MQNVSPHLTRTAPEHLHVAQVPVLFVCMSVLRRIALNEAPSTRKALQVLRHCTASPGLEPGPSKTQLPPKLKGQHFISARERQWRLSPGAPV